jgi:hypothetical protein
VFDVFEIVNGGKEGITGRPSKQRLENAFGTSNVMDVIDHILQHGNLYNVHKGHGTKGHNCKCLQYDLLSLKIYIYSFRFF